MGWRRAPPGLGVEEEAQPGTSPGGSGSGFSPGVAGGIKGTWSRAASRPAAKCPCLSAQRRGCHGEPGEPQLSRPNRLCAASPQAEDAGMRSRKTPNPGTEESQDPAALVLWGSWPEG